MARIHDMADTWNDAGTVFTAIKMNVTDTASHDDSLLMDLQVGGVSKFAFLKRSRIKHTEPLTFQYDGSGVMQINEWNQGLCLTALGQLTWSSSNAPSYTSPGVVLLRESNGILAQRNGSNAQEFRIYNTYTDASNYERGYIRWDSNVFKIGAEGVGTGSPSRAVEINCRTSFAVNFDGSSKFSISNTIVSNGLTFRLASAGTADVGTSSFPWRDIYLRPSSSLTPNANGDLCIEATNDTTLTFKLKGSDGIVRPGTVGLGNSDIIQLAISDEGTDIIAGTGQLTFRMPYAMTLSEVRASVNTAPVGADVIVDINEEGTSILSTKLSIDAGEKTSTTAATPAVISDTALADDAEITIDVDQIGSTTAGKGLKITLIGTRA